MVDHWETRWYRLEWYIFYLKIKLQGHADISMLSEKATSAINERIQNDMLEMQEQGHDIESFKRGVVASQELMEDDSNFALELFDDDISFLHRQLQNEIDLGPTESLFSDLSFHWELFEHLEFMKNILPGLTRIRMHTSVTRSIDYFTEILLSD